MMALEGWRRRLGSLAGRWVGGSGTARVSGIIRALTNRAEAQDGDAQEDCDAQDVIYKVLDPDGNPAFHAPNAWPYSEEASPEEGTWPEPAGAKPGAWMPPRQGDDLSQTGYLLCQGEHQLVRWLGPEIWIAEYEGSSVEHWDRLLVEQARLVRRVDAWNDETARVFTQQTAQRALAYLSKDFENYHDVKRELKRLAMQPVPTRKQGSSDDRGAPVWQSARRVASLSARIALHQSIAAFGFGGNMSGSLMLESETQGRTLRRLLHG